MSSKSIIKNNKLYLYVDNKIFNKKIILNTAYELSNQFYFKISSLKKSFKIVMTPIKHPSNQELTNSIKDFDKILIDYQLRDIIYKETKNIRELIIAKAFAHSEEHLT